MAYPDPDDFNFARVLQPLKHSISYEHELCAADTGSYTSELSNFQISDQVLFPEEQIPIYNITGNPGHFNRYDSPYQHEQDSNQSLHYPNIWPHEHYDEASIEVPMSSSPFAYDYQHSIPHHMTSAQLPSFHNIFGDFAKFPPHSANTIVEPRKEPTRRGRPPTYHKIGYTFHDNDSGVETDEDRRSPNSPSVMRCRKGAKNILLWKFLLEELRKPGAHHIQWVAERDGVFKFVDTAETSKLWGQKKKKEDMNFEKLSRGIRHYYRDGLMSRVDGTRLVYQFNWSRVPKAYRWDRHLPRAR